jgi:hypothetical protein
MKDHLPETTYPTPVQFITPAPSHPVKSLGWFRCAGTEAGYGQMAAMIALASQAAYRSVATEPRRACRVAASLRPTWVMRPRSQGWMLQRGAQLSCWPVVLAGD